MPERDIESLDVMGWGLDAARRFFRRERSELRYILAAYWMPTLRVSSDAYSKLR